MAAHIAGYLYAAAAADGTSPLFLCQGRATSALEASRRVAALAAGLTQLLGMQVGDRVCTAALATDLHLEALLAATAAGAVAAPLNWRWDRTEAAAAAALVGARILLADAACLRFALAAASAAAPGDIDTLVLLGPPTDYRQEDLEAAPPGLTAVFAEALMAGCPDASLALRSAPGNAALVVFTSGTTGKPKGVTLSHAALHSQCMAKLLVCGYSPSDVYLHAAPLFHIGGLSSALAMLAAGARHAFLPRFDGASLLEAIRSQAVTAFIAVPTMVADLLSAAAEAGVASLPEVRRILVGGGGLSPVLRNGLVALCPAAMLQSAYGMTEGASSLTFHTLHSPQAGCSDAQPSPLQLDGPPGGVFVGRPPPGIELAVYQALGGSSSGGAGGSSGGGSGGGGIRLAGEGEVVTRGPHVMLGYWDDEEATAAAQLQGGWMRTGDLGCLNSGRLWLMGRAKDMIKSGGENVHAWEVERALASHPAVAMAAVVGAADWRLGEAVAAAVVLRPGWRWRGERCQMLLASASRQGEKQAAGRAALAAAAAAVSPAGAPGTVAGGGLAGCVLGGGVEEDSEGGQQAAGSIGFEEDLRSMLLQGSTSRPGSSHGADGGFFMAAPLPACGQSPGQQSSAGRQRQQTSGNRRGEALQLLAGIAAGLERAAAAAAGAGASHTGGLGSGASGAKGAEEATVDGRALQLHCRAAGLAGFKLPRVFLMCDAAGAASGRGANSTSSGSAVLLPLNSAGKVVKHLLRQQVQLHMASAIKAAAAVPGSSARSRL